MDHARFHAVAGLTDVFLDNPSWSGHNTALEALPHGLPIVTLPGALMRQRHSAGIVAMTGLTGTIAACRDEYVEIAARLGLDRRARTELRRAVRQAAGKVFHDTAPVRALETLLAAVILARTGPAPPVPAGRVQDPPGSSAAAPPA